MRWDRLFRTLVLGGAALGGGVTHVGCSRDTSALSSTIGPTDATADGGSGGGKDGPAGPDVPREGPLIDGGYWDTGIQDAFIPREGPPPPPPPRDAGMPDTGATDTGVQDVWIPREGPAPWDVG